MRWVRPRLLASHAGGRHNHEFLSASCSSLDHLQQGGHSYKISLQNFHLRGEHDLAENIVHLCSPHEGRRPDRGLAFRGPENPANADGSLGARNGVSSARSRRDGHHATRLVMNSTSQVF